VHGDLVFIACYDGLYAVRVSPAPAGGRPRLSVAWSAKGSRSGPPIVAGGLVWAVAVNGALVGRVEATGVEKYRHSISVAGSYPSPAAARGHLFAPDGDRVASFNGV
jgi:hypothetical protein